MLDPDLDNWYSVTVFQTGRVRQKLDRIRNTDCTQTSPNRYLYRLRRTSPLSPVFLDLIFCLGTNVLPGVNGG